MRQTLNNCLKIGRILLPPHCVLCDVALTDYHAFSAQSQYFCTACFADIKQVSAYCPQCALTSPQGQLCGTCLRHPPNFDTTVAAVEYRFPINSVIAAHKYQQRFDLTAPLAQLLINAISQAQTPMPTTLIAMPMHPQRLKERGFNHAEAIAKLLSAQTGIPLDTNGCQRVRPTVPQAGLALKDRIKNMRGAFACNTPLVAQRIAIVDDVMTTGTSLNALAETLKKAGAHHVECWVVARTMPP